MAEIDIRGLRKIYKNKNQSVEALRGITFQVEKGEITGLLGPNGAGKTTTIKCILGLVKPTEGEIVVEDKDVVRYPKWAARNISAVLEGNRNIFWRMTVYENLKFFSMLQGIPVRWAKGRIEELIEKFGLQEKRNTQARHLSRGMQQKLAVAAAFVKDTPVLLLDEPTLGLDVEASYELREMIKDFAKEEGKTVLLTSHDMGVVEDLCKRVIIINQGRIVADDTVENLKSLFRVVAFNVEIDGDIPDGLVEEIGQLFFRVEVQKNMGAPSVTVELKDFNRFYDLIEIMRSKGVKIRNIRSIEPDFEKVYLKIVKEVNVDAG
jgi:ABC-2 type transport system ATP-binding protein